MLDIFTSDSFRLLQLLGSLEADTVEGPRIRESQEELAVLFSVSKGKLNSLMGKLLKSGCVEKHRARSGYRVTARGRNVLECLEQLYRL